MKLLVFMLGLLFKYWHILCTVVKCYLRNKSVWFKLKAYPGFTFPSFNSWSKYVTKVCCFCQVGIATAHAENEPMLARRVSVHSLPCLVLLIDGKPVVYKESLFSVQKVVGKSVYSKTTQVIFMVVKKL